MKTHIVIIDDEKDICFLLAGMLKHKGYGSSYVHNLSDGFNLLKEKSDQAFLLFLDVNLPDGSGLEAVSKFKCLYPSLKIILMSAFTNLGERADCTYKADIFMSKPFRRENVYDALEKIVASKEA